MAIVEKRCPPIKGCDGRAQLPYRFLLRAPHDKNVTTFPCVYCNGTGKIKVYVEEVT